MIAWLPVVELWRTKRRKQNDIEILTLMKYPLSAFLGCACVMNCFSFHLPGSKRSGSLYGSPMVVYPGSGYKGFKFLCMVCVEYIFAQQPTSAKKSRARRARGCDGEQSEKVTEKIVREGGGVVSHDVFTVVLSRFKQLIL